MSEVAVHEIERLRRYRVWAERDRSIQAIVESTRAEITRTHKRLGQLIDLWLELVPDTLAGQTTVTSLRRGVLHVDVDSAAVVYELDRQLRSGMEAELRRRFGGALNRVKLRVSGGATSQ